MTRTPVQLDPPQRPPARPSRPPGLLHRYMQWLHTRWPAGHVERLPVVGPDGSTNVAGLYVAGDVTGIPLLKFSSDTGARAVRRILADRAFEKARTAAGPDVLDLVIIGAGVAGMAAALEARKHGLRFVVLEATEPFSTIVNFPRGKPIYTYPTQMMPAGDLQFSPQANVKETLLEELKARTLAQGIAPHMGHAQRVVRRGNLLAVEIDGQPGVRAHRVLVAIGRSGNFRKLDVPGEELGKVYNRLHDPKDFRAQDVLVVGGGDSALETAIALAEFGARVTLSYRKSEFSRPKPDNIEKLRQLLADPMADVTVEEPVSERVTTAAGAFMDKLRRPGSIRLMMTSHVKQVREREVVVTDSAGREQVLPNDALFTMLGREAPLDFFRRSGVKIHGEWRPRTWMSFALFIAFCVLLYHWKGGIFRSDLTDPMRLWNWLATTPGWLGERLANPAHLLGTLRISMSGPAFYYTLAYCVCVVFFGLRRIRKRRTPYITVQTLTLMAIQCLPLFVLPEIVLPWLGHNGYFDAGAGRWLANHLFEPVDYGHGRAYWRAYGLILAWPLMVYNVFTEHPMWLWLAICFVQTFVMIPALIYFWGKGAYCGWICSCGALAETLGDEQRKKMPHGPLWNRVNMLGQVILAAALLLLGLRIAGWVWPGSWAGRAFVALFEGIPLLNYKWTVDLLLAGVVGVGFYFWFSGRVWCRFACPLAALMHVYARFSRFRIIADKKKCISCNICTSVCHQGIDIMNFANKGLPMEDPQCVRCSACVHSCPTGVLAFGQVNPRTGQVLRLDRLAASPVQMAEIRVNGRKIQF